MARNPDKKPCKARSKQTGKPCKNWAKPGYDVCHYHGAGGGAPPGNKNAVTTGEHETIWMDTLDDEERVLFYSVPVEVLRQLDNEIRLLEIRERRMLKRINDVMAGWEEDDIETKYERITRKEKVPVHTEDGQTKTETVVTSALVESEITEKKRSKLERVLTIEEALTRVQDKKVKLLELKHKILASNKNNNGEGLLKELADVIRISAEMLGDDDGT